VSALDVNPLGVPAHRHTNPDGSLGGWVADTVTVPASVTVGRYARVYGGTIWGGTIEGGTIWGGTIRGGTIWGGTIEGGTIEGGTIRGGTIRGGAHIVHARHVTTCGPLGSENTIVTLHRTETGHQIVAGCWKGSLDEMIANTVDGGKDEHWGAYSAESRMLWSAEFGLLAEVFRPRIAEWDAEGYPGVAAAPVALGPCAHDTGPLAGLLVPPAERRGLGDQENTP
jgi:hypothetical protein